MAVLLECAPCFVSKHKMSYDSSYPEILEGKISESDYQNILHAFEETFNHVMIVEQPKCEKIAKYYCPCLIIPILGLIYYIYKLKTSYSELRSKLQDEISGKVDEINSLLLSSSNLEIDFSWHSVWRSGKHRKGIAIIFREQ